MPNKETKIILKEEDKRQSALKKKKHDRETEEEKEHDLLYWRALPITERIKQALAIAIRMARVEPTDPFIHDRTYARLMNGSNSPKDYEGVVLIYHKAGGILREQLENLIGPMHLTEHGAKIAN